MGLNAHQIHEVMSQAESSSLNSAFQSSHNVFMRYHGLEGRVRSLSEKIAAGWQGNAAQAAQAGATPLTNMLTAAQGNVSSCRESLTQQGFAVDSVRSSVQPVPPDAPHNNVLNEMTPWHTDLDTQIDNYNNTANVNVAAYNTYVQSSSSNSSTMPSSFPGVAPDGSNVTVTAPDQGGSTSGGWSGTPYSGAGGGSTRTSSAGWGGSPRVGGGSSSPGVGGSGGWTGTPGGLRTDAAQWTNVPGGGPGAGPTGWGPNAGGAPGENRAAFGPLTGGVGGPEGGFGARGGAGSARFGSGAGAGGAGGSGRGAPGAGNAAGAAQEEGMGRGAAGRGMAGAAGARGAAGGPPGGMGGRGGKGEEDSEHRTASYLVGDRSDELAGELPMTAPPVIGE